MTTFLVLIVAVTVTIIVMLFITSKARGAGQIAAPSTGKVTREERRERKAEKAEDRRLPYRHMEPDGLFIVHGTSVWTGIYIPSVTDEHIGNEGQLSIASRQSRMMNAITKVLDRRTDFQLRIVFRETTPAQWAKELISKAKNATPWYVSAIIRIADRLGGQGERTPVRVLLVKLGNIDKRGATGTPADALTGVHDSTLSTSEREEWRQRAREVQGAAASNFGGVGPASREDLIFLVRKPLHGHLPIGAAPDHGRRPWGRGEFAYIADMNGANRKKFIHIKKVKESGEEVESFTCVVVVTKGPEVVPLRKSTAWIRHALAFGEVDLNWRFQLLPNTQMVEALTNIKINLEDEQKNMIKAKVTDAALDKQVAAAKIAEERAIAEERQGLYGSAQFVLSAPTLGELNRLVNDFAVHMERIGVEIKRPNHLQYRLIESAMPGAAPRLSVSPWGRLSDPDMLAVAMPSAGSELGDRVSYDRDGRTALGWRGRQTGWTARDGTTVCHDMHSALARNKAGGVASVGGSGGGKSFHALATCLFESESGVFVLAIDPKEEQAAAALYWSFGPQVNEDGFQEELAAGTLGTPGSKFQPIWPEYWADTDLIDLMRTENGSLDPWIVTTTVAAGAMLAATFLETVMSARQTEVCGRYIETAIGDVVEKYEREVQSQKHPYGAGASKPIYPSMWAVIERLEAMHHDAEERGSSELKIDDLHYAITTMKTLARQPFSRLGFGRHDTRPIDALKKRRTIITMRGFPTPPGTDASEWPADMRAGAGAMILALEIGTSMLTNDGRRKLMILDEAHIVLALPLGRGVVRRGLRVGRSSDSVYYILSQQAPDLKRLEEESEDGEGANQFHAIYAYRQRSDAEAKTAVALLGLDPTDPAVLASVQEPALETGMCVFRDADNRTGTMIIDQFWIELRAATETNPALRRDAQSRPFNPDVSTWTWADDPDPLAEAA